ncbi:invasion protein CiaB [Helicobacter mesocricetorum]|uniref:invasion protein CiaB n=1 Tax=Helicobacter mesocricetorum TaxID=87012 RepID=UPI000CF092D8|nr:invasion protein CiaB [Helicobacter mesocricetorum]
MEDKIFSDIVRIYRFLEDENKAINALYENLSIQNVPSFLEEIFASLPQNEEILLALLDRVLSLKEASLENILKKFDYSEEKILEIKDLMLLLTEKFYTQKHQNLLNFIQSNQILTPFLRELIGVVHKIGLCFNKFFRNWQKALILGINRELKEKYHNDLSAILGALQTSLEVTRDGEVSDRSYSIPVLRDTYQAVAYVDFFQEEFLTFKKIFEESLPILESIQEICPKLEQKEAYLKYLKALQQALLQNDTRELLESWREVDRCWMQITSPLQIGHPLEYYEDHFRRAVAPEWDLRIARIYEGRDLSTNASSFSINKESFLGFYQELTLGMPDTPFKPEVDKCVEESLKKVQSYGGMPLLFYGAELNGLFSAQVVPNDESVSAKYGKKIFYFPDRVRELSCAKPFMLLSSKTFSQDFLDFNRELLYFRKEDWYKVYEISTIGHEFGHILWVSFDSELQMNKSGEFKNIEEFKATMGGLAYYFLKGDLTLLKELVFNTIARAVSLIAWQRENEVLPYYCEGLIHLDVLFSSQILSYRGDFENIALSIDYGKVKALRDLYLETYKQLIIIYLEKMDAKEFLMRYMKKDKKGVFKPIKTEVLAFVEDYYKMYQEIGQRVDSITPQIWTRNYIRKHNERSC